MFDKKDYLLWVKEKNWMYNRFKLIQSYFTNFFEENLFDNKHLDAKVILGNLGNVLSKCNTINFDDKNIAYSYAIMHFLDRYHRFQEIGLCLIENDSFPSYSNNLDILDVGTGPSPALFAFSDVYLSLREYCQYKQIPYMTNKKIKLDYVEKGNGFRFFLHHFTEYINSRASHDKEIGWEVPYHHGSHYDFKEIEFNLNDGNYKKKYRYNMIILSNFITQKDDVKLFSSSLFLSLKHMRNNGIFLIVGSQSKEYEKIYEEIQEFMGTKKFSDNKFKSYVFEKKFSGMKMETSYSDEYGELVKEFYEKLLNLIMKKGEMNWLEEKDKELLKKIIQPKYNFKNKWRNIVYQKISKFRWGKKSKKANPSY